MPYINPYYLMSIPDDIREVPDLAMKKLYYKKVNAEAELNGNVIIRNGKEFNRSDFLKSYDELDNSILAKIHFKIYKEKNLLHFLMFGESASLLNINKEEFNSIITEKVVGKRILYVFIEQFNEYIFKAKGNDIVFMMDFFYNDNIPSEHIDRCFMNVLKQAEALLIEFDDIDIYDDYDDFDALSYLKSLNLGELYYKIPDKYEALKADFFDKWFEIIEELYNYCFDSTNLNKKNIYDDLKFLLNEVNVQHTPFNKNEDIKYRINVLLLRLNKLAPILYNVVYTVKDKFKSSPVYNYSEEIGPGWPVALSFIVIIIFIFLGMFVGNNGKNKFQNSKEYFNNIRNYDYMSNYNYDSINKIIDSMKIVYNLKKNRKPEIEVYAKKLSSKVESKYKKEFRKSVDAYQNQLKNSQGILLQDSSRRPVPKAPNLDSIFK